LATILGRGDYVYEELADWARLPAGATLKEVADVAVDSQDRIYVFNRGEHPMLVFDRQGNLLASWGEGRFTRPHGLTIGLDDTLYCVDDGAHCIYKCAPDGRPLMTIGTPGMSAPRQSGQPFNQPTKVALDPKTGDLYIADGYGNARVHKYSAEGSYLFSWGEYGTDPGQFNLVHSICSDDEGSYQTREEARTRSTRCVRQRWGRLVCSLCSPPRSWPISATCSGAKAATTRRVCLG